MIIKNEVMFILAEDNLRNLIIITTPPVNSNLHLMDMTSPRY